MLRSRGRDGQNRSVECSRSEGKSDFQVVLKQVESKLDERLAELHFLDHTSHV